MTEFERVDLPSGNHAILRDPEQTTEAQRRPAKLASLRLAGISDALRDPAALAALPDVQADSLFRFSETVAVALIESWSFDLPVTVEGLQQIPGAKDYQTLLDATKKHQPALMPDFGPSGDVEDPTGDSPESSGSS